MKPILILIDSNNNQSISIRKCVEVQFQNPWHFHKELELVFVVKGEGTYFIGDHIGQFKIGDIILMGNNLPHMLKNKISYNKIGKAQNAEAIVIHFSEQFLGKDYLQIPEMISVLKLLNMAKRGIRVSYTISENIAHQMMEMLKQTPFQRILELLQILQKITEEPKIKLLCSMGFIEKIQRSQNNRLNHVYEFVMNNFSRQISLVEIANIANMNKTAFCKYFKDQTTKSFIQFVTEVRINYAKRLLMEGDRYVAEIGYECGFNNISNFNRQFRKIVGETPGSFKKKSSQKL